MISCDSSCVFTAIWLCQVVSSLIGFPEISVKLMLSSSPRSNCADERLLVAPQQIRHVALLLLGLRAGHSGLVVRKASAGGT